MEFLATLPNVSTKSVYPCLASITIAPPGEVGGQSGRNRRLSASSAEGTGSALGDDQGEGDNIIKRVISGNRRKSSFGTNTTGGTASGPISGGGVAGAGAGNDTIGGHSMADRDRRKSIAPSAFAGVGGVQAGSNASGPEGVERGTWFWRVQAGVHDQNLVLLPLTQPANSLLTAPPAPLSSAMPGHHKDNKAGHDADEGGLVDKVKSLFRRGSTTTKDNAHNAPTASVAGENPAKPLDQTEDGDQLPSAHANAAGATNVNANAETGWPGMVNGQKLQAIVIPLNQIDKHKVKVSGGKRGEASWVTVPVTSHFAHMIQGHQDGASAPKSGVIRLEFDKDWIGSKGEAELLHHHITSALANRSPQTTNIQLGGGHHNGTAAAQPSGLGATGVGAGASAGANSGLGSGSGLTGGMVGSGSGIGVGHHHNHATQGQTFQDDIAPDQTVPFDHQTAGSGQLDNNHLTLGQAIGYTPDESVASSRKVAG